MIKRRSLSVTAALLIGLSGCGEDDQPSSNAEASAVRAQMAWNSAQQQTKELQDIENRLVRRCLTEQGFRIFPPEPPPSNKSGDRRQLVSPDPADAARIGYGLDPRRQIKQEGGTDGSDYYNGTTDEYKARLTRAEYGPEEDTVSFITPDGGTKVSTPRSGCLGHVRTRLYGDVKEYLRLSFTANNLVGQNESAKVKDDVKLADTIGRWRKCVDEAGYPGTQSTAEMRDKARRLYEGIASTDNSALDAALASEIRIATADATCNKSVGLNESYATAQAKAASKSLAKHETDLVAWNAMVRKALAKAQEMLKG